MRNTGYLILSLLFTVVFNCGLRSQNREEARIDKLMAQIPESSTVSSDALASYIKENIVDQKYRAYAIFSWITGNIEYDVENMFSINFYQSKEEVVSDVLSSGKGICLHFSFLFQDIASRVGIKSYVVMGYTRQNGLVDQIPHSWCAGLMDSTWYLFDPSWGSGYFENGSFIRHRNRKYFMVSPSKLIRTHMPYDPMWQFLYYPITNRDFYSHKTEKNTGNVYFNYADSINKYDNLGDLQKFELSITRIRQNGVVNVLIARELEYLYDQILTYRYNTIVNQYNEGIGQLNQAILIWNEFNPSANTNRIMELLDLSELNLALCVENLSKINDQNGLIKTSVSQLYSLLDIGQKSINNLRASVERFKNSRK